MMFGDVGAIVIGRNEGARLTSCFQSFAAQVSTMVYVDSGSRDESIAVARSFGASIVELDPSIPFTAARARNAGFERLMLEASDTRFVQFIDGDCELQRNWLAVGTGFFGEHPKAAVVCGRVRERFPDSSPYNRLCDMEWDTPIGETASCGGISLMRAAAFRSSGGFDSRLIAGEEPDLCYRLRLMGWKIFRIDAEMSLHDAGMSRLGQWWQRSKRSGYADMEASQRRGHDEPHLRRKVWSNLFWGMPLAWPLWPLLWVRVQRRHGSLYATHIVAGKVPHLHGQAAYWIARLLRRTELIEYK